mgnify:FL=1
MAAARIPRPLDRLVRERAGHRCEYCRSSEFLSGQRFHVDHILPRTLAGKTTSENLCVACASCNSSKLARVEAPDPESGVVVALFNPRAQHWPEHFE